MQVLCSNKGNDVLSVCARARTAFPNQASSALARSISQYDTILGLWCQSVGFGPLPWAILHDGQYIFESAASPRPAILEAVHICIVSSTAGL